MVDDKKEGLSTLFNDQYGHGKVKNNAKLSSKKSKSKSHNSVAKKSKLDSNKSKSTDCKKKTNNKSNQKSNPIWNVQIRLRQSAELYAVKSLEGYSSRSKALQLLIDKFTDLISDKDKAMFKSFKNNYLMQYELKHRNN